MSVLFLHTEHPAASFFIGSLPLRIGAAGGQDGGRLPSGGDHVGVHWRAQVGVTEDTDGAPAAWDAAGQAGVIRQHGAHSHHDAPIAVTLLLDVVAGGFAGDPLGRAGVGGDLAIQGHGVL